VVMIGDEATVKRYYPEGDSIRFQPATPPWNPSWCASGFPQRESAGVVIGVYRKLH